MKKFWFLISTNTVFDFTWSMQATWIEIRSHKTWGFIFDLHCLTFKYNFAENMVVQFAMGLVGNIKSLFLPLQIGTWRLEYSVCQLRADAYKNWVWDWFETQWYVQSLFEQSQHYLAYMWLLGILKLQKGQIMTMSKSDQSGARVLTCPQTQTFL